jgi:transketolase
MTASAVAGPELGMLAARIRRIVVDESWRAGVGHIGSALSIADIVAALYGATLAGTGAERDRFVLSKGHAALALYAALAETGRMPIEQLETYCGDDSLLGAHPEHALPGIDFSTGSLGQGLSLGVGAALAAHRQRSPRRTFVLLSDAECNEGSIWEAAMFAAHHRLSSLVAIVDVNGQQALGYTHDVLDPGPARARWQASGWHALVVDGHDAQRLSATIATLDMCSPGPPTVLLADTVFGKGVSFMERRIEWHYLPLDDAQHQRAVDEVAMAEAST